MKMRSTFLAAVLVASGAPLLAGTANAAPWSSSLALKDAHAATAVTEQVQWRRGWGGRGRGWGWGPAAAGAIVGGAIVGGALASGPYGYYGTYGNPDYGYYDGPTYYRGGGYVAGGYGGGDEVAYCQQRFRSYDPASGTYLGYDGLRHPCP